MPKTSHDSKILAEGQQVITAAAFIVHTFDGIPKVFLPKRAATKKFLPDVYELPGGHIDYGENLVTGLQREVLEEFEKEITVTDAFYAFTYLNEVKKSHSVEVIFMAAFVGGIDDIVLHPEDHSEYVWADKDTAVQLYLACKGEDDAELPAIYKGFEILETISN